MFWWNLHSALDNFVLDFLKVSSLKFEISWIQLEKCWKNVIINRIVEFEQKKKKHWKSSFSLNLWSIITRFIFPKINLWAIQNQLHTLIRYKTITRLLVGGNLSWGGGGRHFFFLFGKMIGRKISQQLYSSKEAFPDAFKIERNEKLWLDLWELEKAFIVAKNRRGHLSMIISCWNYLQPS